jgi:hypothetical protein
VRCEKENCLAGNRKDNRNERGNGEIQQKDLKKARKERNGTFKRTRK